MLLRKTKQKKHLNNKEEKGSDAKGEKTREAQLSIDIFETNDFFFIQSPIAAVKSKDLKISVEDKILTIRGEREKPILTSGKYIYKECYWGKFSRKIILPDEVDSSKVEATLEDGLLTVKIQRINKKKKEKEISVKEID